MIFSHTNMEAAVSSRNAEALVVLLKTALLQGPTGRESDVAAWRNVAEFLKLCSAQVATKIDSALKSTRTAAPLLATSTSGSRILLRLDNLQCLEPRGRLDVNFYETGITLENKSGTLHASWDDIRQVICVPNNMAAKKDSEDLLVLVFGHPLQFHTKPMKSAVLVLSKVAKCKLSGGSSEGSEGESFIKLIVFDLLTFASKCIRDCVHCGSGAHSRRPR
jgi:hypothetical protein